jgi:hypothetical protein
MSPPEIWGPAIWSLFHTLAVNINETTFLTIHIQLFNHIRNICSYLPCPECSKDATKFLAKLNINNIKTKIDFINTFYIFHNFVNKKKHKPLFNYANMNNYTNNNLVKVINNFINNYKTKGNMKLLNESFQRQIIVKNFKQWFITNIKAFIKVAVLHPLSQYQTIDVEESDVENVSLQKKDA